MPFNVNLLAAAVAVATTDIVMTVNTKEATCVGLEVKNTGAAALDAFEVWGATSDDPAATKFNLLNIDANFTTPVYPCIKASAGPCALAPAASVWISLNVEAFAFIYIKASSAAAVTTLQLLASVK